MGPEGRADTVLGDVPCPGRQPGERVVVAVSPDAFFVCGNGDPRATIVGAQFRGRYYAYEARRGDETFRVHLKERLAVGDEVSLGLLAEPVIVREE